MKHLKLFEYYSSLNENTDYSTLGEDIPFKNVVKFLQNYQDEGNIAVLGYNKKISRDNYKFVVIPFKEAKFDKNLSYLAALMTIDIEKQKMLVQIRGAQMKAFANSVGRTNLDDIIDKEIKDKETKSLHDYVHIQFLDDGMMIAAQRFAGNDVDWFVSEFGMFDEYSDEYQEYMQAEFGEDGDED